MPLLINDLPRVFTFNRNGKDIELADPNPAMSAKEVLSFFSNTYPELTNAGVEGPGIRDDKTYYTFKTTLGTKG
jgi:PRTRC genetic system protein C